MKALHYSGGPWTIDGNFDDEVGVSIQTPDGNVIVEVYPFTGEWSAEDIGNAKLLAAPTQLLQVLQAALADGADWRSHAEKLINSLKTEKPAMAGVA